MGPQQQRAGTRIVFLHCAMQLRCLARESAFARRERRQRERGRDDHGGLRLDGIRVVFLAQYRRRGERHGERHGELHRDREHHNQPAKHHDDGRGSDHHHHTRRGVVRFCRLTHESPFTRRQRR